MNYALFDGRLSNYGVIGVDLAADVHLRLLFVHLRPYVLRFTALHQHRTIHLIDQITLCES